MKNILFTLALLVSFSSFGQQMTNFDLEQYTFNFSIGKTIKEGKMIFSDNSNIDKNSISIALQKLHKQISENSTAATIFIYPPTC